MSCNRNTEPIQGGADGGSWLSALGLAVIAVSFGVPTWWENVKAKKQAYLVKEKEEKDQRDEENREKTEKIKQELAGQLKDLDPLESLLIKRQDIFCSLFKLKSERTKVEDMIRKDFMYKYPAYREELERIISNDTLCAAFWNDDKKKNGRLMWEFLATRRSEIQKRLEDINTNMNSTSS